MSAVNLSKVLTEKLGRNLDFIRSVNELRNRDLDFIHSIISNELKKNNYKLTKNNYTDDSIESIIEDENFGLIILKGPEDLLPLYILFHHDTKTRGQPITIEYFFIGNKIKGGSITFNFFTTELLNKTIITDINKNYKVYGLYNIEPISVGGKKICKYCKLPIKKN